MNINSIMNGLEEAIKISDGKLVARRRRVTILPVVEFSNQEVKNLRTSLKLTQFSFSQVLGVTVKTVEAWEKGTNSPNGPARRLMSILKEEPDTLKKHHILG